MNNTVYYDKYPETIWRAFLLLVYVTLIKTTIEVAIGLASGVYLGIYTAVTNQDFNILIDQVTDTISLTSVTISDLALISILIYSMRKRRQVPIRFKDALSRRPSPRLIVLSILGVFGVSFAGGLITQSLSTLINAQTPEHIESMMVVENVLSFESLMTFVAVVLAAPLFEEFLLRKIMMDGLLRNYKPVTVIVTSAIFFAIFHMNFVQGAYTFFLGLYLAYIYYLTGSYWLVTVIHAINNLYAVIVRLVPEALIGPIALVFVAVGFIALVMVLRANDERVEWQDLPEPEVTEDQSQNDENSDENLDEHSEEAVETGNA